MAKLEVGLEGESSLTVGGANTARAMGSGTVDVLATPAVIALMEQAAVQAVAAVLPAGQTSVGTEIHVHHIAATPPGLQVTAHASLTGIDGRRLYFHVTAHDERELIAKGTHTRVIVDQERFLAHAQTKSHPRRK